MQIEIQAVEYTLTEGLRGHILRRLQFALGRFRDRVARISVRLSDLNGPRGGVDKVCRLQIRLHGMPDILIEDSEADQYMAISRAADRAGRTLGRRLRRARAGRDVESARHEHERSE